MATIQDFEERIEKQKAELAKLEAKKKELEKKIRERNRKWRSLVTHSAGESVLSAVGCAWQELDLDALDCFLANHADEVCDLLAVHGECKGASRCAQAETGKDGACCGCRWADGGT